jgi:hypothetical protein
MRVFSPSLVCLLILCAATCGADSGSIPYWQQLDLPHQPEEVLHDILQSEEFRDAAEKSFLERIRDALAQMNERFWAWVLSLIPDVRPDAVDPDALNWLIRLMFWSIGLCALVLAGYYLVTFIMSRRYGAMTRPYVPTAAVHRMPPSSELWESALQKGEQGLYREGVIDLFRYVLATLHERGLLALHPGKTSREIVRGLRGDSVIREPLAEMTRRFNRARYGDTPCTQTDYDQFMDLCRQTTEKAAS